MITGDLIRTGRALLGWSAKTLAARAQVGTATVLRIERSRDAATGQAQTIEKLVAALREAGVEFMADERHGTSVHLRRQ
jgi:transcriptional regulator with XRE-family HTH domain